MEVISNDGRPTTPSELDDLIETLTSIRSAMLELDSQGSERYQNVHQSCLESLQNLLPYIALCRNDLRSVQQHLSALGQRAECVMLNKGPHIVTAVKVLDDIRRTMAGHQGKKRQVLRPLQLARMFGKEAAR